MKKVIVVGGGFAGLSCAINLAKHRKKDLSITVISNSSDFVYKGRLYKIFFDYPLENICFSLPKIFSLYPQINFFVDSLIAVDFNSKKIKTEKGMVLSYDFLVLALGSEVCYFDIPGLKKYAFSFYNINDCLALKDHLRESFHQCRRRSEENLCRTHIVVVGGGETGVEAASALVFYTKKLAKEFRINSSLITIDLVHSRDRLIPKTFPDVSEKILQRVRELGINVYLNRRIMKEEIEKVFLNDLIIRAKTLVWTAGVQANSLYKKLGFAVDDRGRVSVDQYLRAKNSRDIFVLGDGAATSYSGTAQTAIYDGEFSAKNILRLIDGKTIKTYHPKVPKFSIPVGEKWASVILGPLKLYGKLGWFAREMIEIKALRKVFK